jgi:hypothetical protein
LPAVAGWWRLHATYQLPGAAGSQWKAKQVKKTTNGAATLAKFINLKQTADYYRAHAKENPIWRERLSAKLCRRMAPLVKLLEKKFHLSPIQARTVLVDIGYQKLFGVNAPGARAA